MDAFSMMMNAARKDNGVNDLVHIDSSTDSSEDDFCMDIVDKEHVPVPKVGGVSPPVPAKVAGEGNFPASEADLENFRRVFKLKTDKYLNVDVDKLPFLRMKTMPLALPLKVFVKNYWPGPLACCGVAYSSCPDFFEHVCAEHKSPDKSGLDLAPYPTGEADVLPEFIDVEKDIADTDKDECSLLKPGSTSSVGSVRSSTDNTSVQASPARTSSVASTTNGEVAVQPSAKKRTLSPTSRPSPMRVKMSRMMDKKSTAAEDSNGSVAEAVDESGEEDRKAGPGRPRRSCTQRTSNDVDDEGFVSDKQKYPSQHDPDTAEGFLADQSRITYFMEVFKVKNEKYSALQSHRVKSPSRFAPLALNVNGFVRNYWPGKAMCCGLARETIAELTSHINQHHRPPKPPPNLSVIQDNPGDNNGGVDDASTTDSEVSTNSDAARTPGNSSATTPSQNNQPMVIKIGKDFLSEKNTKEFPEGFLADQNKYAPSHKQGDPEDFYANKEAIEYFNEVFNVKVSKYPHLQRSKKIPLAGGYSMFAQHYWPGIVGCCGIVHKNSNSFRNHVAMSHVPPKKPPALTLAKPEPPPPPPPAHAKLRKSLEAPASTVASAPAPAVAAATVAAPAMTAAGVTSAVTVPLAAAAAAVAPAANPVFAGQYMQPNGKLVGNTFETISCPNAWSAAVQAEVRKLRVDMDDSNSLNSLLPMLCRVLFLAMATAGRMRSTSDKVTRMVYLECAEFVWNSVKSATLRWEKLKKEPTDFYLDSVRHLYSSVAVDWDTRSVSTFLSCSVLAYNNIVQLQALLGQSVPPPPASARVSRKRESVLDLLSSQRPDVAKSSPVKSERGNEKSPAAFPSPPDLGAVASSSNSPRKLVDPASGISHEEFCRLMNIAINQNTKARSSSGYKDDGGFYHPMFRYGTAQILKLFAPSTLSKLKCCGKVMPLAGVRAHVQRKHEFEQDKEKTFMSIMLP